MSFTANHFVPVLMLLRLISLLFGASLSMNVALNNADPDPSGPSGPSLSPVPGLDMIAKGYNIITGNPEDTAGYVDVGFKGQIFNTSIFTAGNTCRLNGEIYSVFNGVTCSEAVACTSHWSYTNASGIQSYSEQLSKSVDASAKYGPFQFGGSKSYQSVYEYTLKQAKVLSNAFTQCSIYIANIQSGSEPPFTSGFVNSVEKMPLTYNKSSEANTNWFYEFFTHDYGTHYISKISSGAEFGQYSTLSWYAYDTYLSSTYNIASSAKWLAAFTGGLSYSESNQKSEADTFEQMSLDFHTYSIGCPLPTGSAYPGNATKWLKEVYKSPIPLFLSMPYEIFRLLQNAHLWNGTGINSDALKQKASALEQATDDYCWLFKAQNPSLAAALFCNGDMPPDPENPSKSVFKGVYSDISGGINPYTGSANCPSGYQAHQFAVWEARWYYCLDPTFKRDGHYYDPMGAFGGMFIKDQTANLCIDKNGANGANLFTGECSCPGGYSAERFMICKGGSSAHKHYWYTWWCRNNTGVYHDRGDRSIIGGFVQEGNIVVNNQFSNTLDCAPNTVKYNLGTWQCNNDGQKKCSLYVCLSNVYHA